MSKQRQENEAIISKQAKEIAKLTAILEKTIKRQYCSDQVKQQKEALNAYKKVNSYLKQVKETDDVRKPMEAGFVQAGNKQTILNTQAVLMDLNADKSE